MWVCGKSSKNGDTVAIFKIKSCFVGEYAVATYACMAWNWVHLLIIKSTWYMCMFILRCVCVCVLWRLPLWCWSWPLCELLPGLAEHSLHALFFPLAHPQAQRQTQLYLDFVSAAAFHAETCLGRRTVLRDGNRMGVNELSVTEEWEKTQRHAGSSQAGGWNRNSLLCNGPNLHVAECDGGALSWDCFEHLL